MVRHIYLAAVAAFVLLPLAAVFGQTPEHLRPDSVLLSVYNTGNKYRLTPTTFSVATDRTTWVTDMVWVTDTVVSFKDGGSNATLPDALLSKMPDSLRQKFTSQRTMKMVISQKCDKPMLPSEVEGKVVILALSDCDASQKALLAQRAGAKAIVFVHQSNNPNDIEIKTGQFKDSIRIPCYSVRKDIGTRISSISGIYKRQKSTQKLELKSDGTYTLFNTEQTFTPVFEQCEIASAGKWSALSNDLLELISEDNYLKQKGFEYELKKENKFSQDSLYFQVNFSTDFHPIKLDFTFNNNNSKSIKTEKANIVIPKSKHLWDKKINTNQINSAIRKVNCISILCITK